MPQAYQTVAHEATAQFVEKRSRFIGYACPINDEEAAMQALAARRKLGWDARHHVWAYVLKSGAARCSDDGEPQGTAGVPVLEVLQKSGVTDCLMVVTRYFGGILLGAGGLVRAYTHTASLALEAAEPLWMRPCTAVSVRCDYSQYGAVSALLAAQTSLSEPIFDEAVTLSALLPTEQVDAVQAALTELSAGSLFLSKGEETFAPFSSK